MQDEITFREYAKAVKENRKFIVGFILVFMFLTFAVLSFWPKKYESESVIQLGKAGGEIYSPAEAKNILESSTILRIALKDYPSILNLGAKKIRQKNIFVSMISERGDLADIKSTSFIRILVKAGSAEGAKDINEKITQEFFKYVSPDYEKRLAFLKYELEKIARDIAPYEYVSISNLPDSSIVGQKNRYFDIQEALAKKTDFKIISEPELPKKPSSPKVTLTLSIAFILSIVIVFGYIFAKATPVINGGYE